jgi:cytochrome c
MPANVGKTTALHGREPSRSGAVHESGTSVAASILCHNDATRNPAFPRDEETLPVQLSMGRPAAGLAAAAVWAACCLAASGPAGATDAARGRYLAGECVSCHPRDNTSAGIPSIVGWPADRFVAVLRSYRAKERPNPVMQSVAAGLSEEDMAALAAYFATLGPAR